MALMLALGLGGCAWPKTPDRASPPVVTADPPPASDSAAKPAASAKEAFARGIKVWQAPTGASAAVHWFRRAAMRRDAAAAYFLSVAYAEGRGVGRNPKKAYFWLKRAADLGNAKAEYFVGLGFTNGRHAGDRKGLGVEWSDAWAARWYGKAAAQGDVPGEYMLGLFYALGFGLPEDPVTAYKWLWLAARAKYGPAETTLQVLTPKLSAAARARAVALASAWRPRRRDAFADGPTVRFVQVVLTRLGFDPGKIDGKYGPRTAAAVAAYEASRGMDDSGHISGKLLLRLKSAPNPPKIARKQPFEEIW
jgi:hypothetical protein